MGSTTAAPTPLLGRLASVALGLLMALGVLTVVPVAAQATPAAHCTTHADFLKVVKVQTVKQVDAELVVRRASVVWSGQIPARPVARWLRESRYYLECDTHHHTTGSEAKVNFKTDSAAGADRAHPMLESSKQWNAVTWGARSRAYYAKKYTRISSPFNKAAHRFNADKCCIPRAQEVRMVHHLGNLLLTADKQLSKVVWPRYAKSDVVELTGWGDVLAQDYKDFPSYDIPSSDLRSFRQAVVVVHQDLHINK